MKNRIILRLLSLLLLFVLICPLFACVYTQQQREDIVEAFEALGYNDQYIFYESGTLCIGSRMIDVMDEIDCEGEYCNILLCEAEGAYAYYGSGYPSAMKYNLVYVDYETLTPTFIAAQTLFNVAWVDSFYDQGRFYIKVYHDGEALLNDQEYYVCDPSTGGFVEIVDDAGILAAEAICQKAHMSEDLNRSERYDIAYYDPIEEGVEEGTFPGIFDSVFFQTMVDDFRPRIRITEKETGEMKELKVGDFLAWAEGKIPHLTNMYTLDYLAAYEKDGDIYVLGGVQLDYLCYLYVMKYDFASEELSYYTSFLYEEWPGGQRMQICIP